MCTCILLCFDCMDFFNSNIAEDIVFFFFFYNNFVRFKNWACFKNNLVGFAVSVVSPGLFVLSAENYKFDIKDFAYGFFPHFFVGLLYKLYTGLNDGRMVNVVV